MRKQEINEQFRFWKCYLLYVFRSFKEDKCSSVAAELTVTSILALVPLATVIFSLLAFIPDFENVSLKLQVFLFEYFVPTTGNAVQSYLQEFVGKAKEISGIGFVMLLVTALLMMRSIDTSFNHIWKIKKNKSVIRTFLVYWAVLTLGPILLGTSLLLTSYLQTLPLLSGVVNEHSRWMTLAFPMLMEIMTFTLMFYIVPNRKVLLKHAFIASFISAVLFELAKLGFAVFVESFSTYQLIFGALAIIPLFLIWIYLSWMIVLFGAEICHALFAFEISLLNSKKQPLIQVMQILELLSSAQEKGEAVNLSTFKANDFNNVESFILCLDKLVDCGVVGKLENQSYCLKVNKNELIFKLPYEISNKEFPSDAEIKEGNINQTTQNQLLSLIKKHEELLKSKIEF